MPNQIHKKDITKDYVKEQKDETKSLYLLPLLIIVAILPLIMRLHIYNAHLSDNVWFSVEDEYADFFLYGKQVVFLILSLFMALLASYQCYKDRKILNIPKIFIPLTLYAFFIILSTLLSKYKYYSFHGIYEQFESAFVLLGYILTTFYVYLIIKTEKEIKYIIAALLIGSLILGFIGLTQISGNDFFTTQTGWRLVTHRGYWNAKDLFNFNFANTVYLTLYNPNYVGTYASMVLPILIIVALITKEFRLKSLYLLGTLGIVISLIGSKSSTGIVSLCFAFILAIILFRKKFLKHIYITISILIITIITLIILNFANDNYIINQFNKITNIQKTTPALKEIQTNTNNLIIKYNSSTLQIDFYLDEDGICMFNVYDGDFLPVHYVRDTVNGPITLLDDRFPGFVLTPSINEDGALAFSVSIDGYLWNFTNQVLDRTYYYINDYGKYDKIISAPSALFTGYENYASGRGYIWSRTIPLLRDRIFYGTGPDTFSFAFPNRDYVNKYNYSFLQQLISKPHNMYLQIGVQTGVLSLIAFVSFYMFYFFSSIKLYIREEQFNFYSYVGIAILISTSSYMVSGIANDSSITVAPIFWVLIGLGIIINQHVYKGKNTSLNKDNHK